MKPTADLFTPQSLSEAETLRLIKKKKREKWEDLFESQIRAARLPPFERQYRFAKPERQWPLDHANLEFKVYVEIQGGLFSHPVVCGNCHKPVTRYNPTTGKRSPVMEAAGGHSRIEGITRDAEKAAALACRGWTGFPCVPSQVESGAALDWLTTVLKLRGWQKGGFRSQGSPGLAGGQGDGGNYPLEPEAPQAAPRRGIRAPVRG
jgi:hypothetical protein